MRKLVLGMVIVFMLTAVGGLLLSHADPKYLEKGINKTMIEWNKALGVKCGFCHTSDRSQTYKSLAGKTVSEEELKALVHQRIARAMLGNMLYVNKTEMKDYTCNTCHQGSKEVEVEE